MDEKLIKIRDFAEANGCTPQNIYLHLKTYAQELEGHLIKGKGRQGVLLDEFAQDFLKSVMYPKELGENITAQENEKLRAALAQALQENARLLSRALTAEHERDQAMLREGESQRLLTASQEAQEAQAAELYQAQINVAALTELNQEAQSQLTTVRGELSEAQDIIETQERNLEIGNKARAKLAEDLEAERKRNQALKDRNLWQRIIRKGE